jgi:GntR family transcriptional regulator
MSVDLDLSVDRTSELPLGTQLMWKLRTLVSTGVLPAGARLPGIRDLAELAGVNINTVRSVLARLEEQGLLVTQQGRGSFVADSARLHTNLAQTADAAILQAQAAGVDPRELAATMYVTSRAASTSGVTGEIAATGQADRVPATDQRAERQKLRADIQKLELELAELEPLSPLEQRRSKPEARILSAAELRNTRDALTDRLDRLKQDRREWRAETERLLAVERRSAEGPWARRWSAGVWTGRPGADVSWRTA